MKKIKITERSKILVFKIFLFIFAFIVAFMPSTASRNLEVNSRVIVEMLGLDGGDGIELTAQYIMPTETEGATTKDKVTVKADTLSEAVEALNTTLGRRAELGQCSVVVVGESLEPEILGTLMTATDVTADTYLAAADGKAKDSVGDITDFMKKTSATDAAFIAYAAKKAHVATTTLLNFLSDLGSASHTAFIPVVEITKEKSGEGGGSGSGESGSESSGSGGNESGGESGGNGGGESEKPVGMTVEKLAVYGENGRAGVLEKAAARGVAWVSAPIENSIVTADVEYDGEVVKNVSARLKKKKASIDVDAENKRATVKLKATLEPNGDRFNALDAEGGMRAAEAVKAGFAEVIAREIRTAYDEGGALSADPLFIGRQFYRFEPDFYESGYALGGVELDIEVKIDIK